MKAEEECRERDGMGWLLLVLMIVMVEIEDGRSEWKGMRTMRITLY